MNASESTNPIEAPAAVGKWPTLSIPADTEGRQRLVLAGLGLAIIFYAYFINNTCFLNITGSPAGSVARWLKVSWDKAENDFQHGYIVPLICIGLFYWKWSTKLRLVPTTKSNAGLVVLALASLMYWAGVKAVNPRVVAMSAVVLAYGLVLYLGGWRWAKELWFPCAFLLFMIPLDFQSVALRLRMFMTHLSALSLNILGMDVIQDGTGIKSRTGRFEPLDVANPCSGIRSLVALTALASVYGYVTMDKGWKKWVLFFSSVPLAVIGNWARIMTIVLVAQGFGQDVAMKIYHEFSGYIVFSLAILCMIGLGTLLHLNYRELIHHLTKDEVEIKRPPPRRNNRR